MPEGRLGLRRVRELRGSSIRSFRDNVSEHLCDITTLYGYSPRYGDGMNPLLHRRNSTRLISLDQALRIHITDTVRGHVSTPIATPTLIVIHVTRADPFAIVLTPDMLFRLLISDIIRCEPHLLATSTLLNLFINHAILPPGDTLHFLFACRQNFLSFIR
jgi:hypothetical protein